MRILWHSCKPTIGTGYGTQTRLIVPRLANLGHEVAISCHAGMYGEVAMWNGIKIFPHSAYPGKYGMDIIEHHAKHFKPDVIVSWVDAFVLMPEKIKQLAEGTPKVPWIAWVPVDSDPLMVRNLPTLKECARIAAPTRWGVEVIKRSLPDRQVDFVPCGVDPDVYYPTDFQHARKQFGELIGVDIGDKFLINVVSANSGTRKNFEGIFRAWKLFHEQCPDSLLYLHTDPSGYFTSGEKLEDMAAALGVLPDGIIYPAMWEYVTGAIGDDYLCLLHNASDCHLNMCHGEGFGLPIMEAQFCGCPAVVPGWGATEEICLGENLTARNGESFYGVPGGMQFAASPISVCSILNRLHGYGAYRHMSIRFDLARRAIKQWSIERTVSAWDELIRKF